MIPVPSEMVQTYDESGRIPLDQKLFTSVCKYRLDKMNTKLVVSLRRKSIGEPDTTRNAPVVVVKRLTEEDLIQFFNDRCEVIPSLPTKERMTSSASHEAFFFETLTVQIS